MRLVLFTFEFCLLFPSPSSPLPYPAPRIWFLPAFSYTIDFGKLNLTTLNLADNRIRELPLSMRSMSSLQNLILDNNPLMLPPAHVGVSCIYAVMYHVERRTIGGAQGSSTETMRNLAW